MAAAERNTREERGGRVPAFIRARDSIAEDAGLQVKREYVPESSVRPALWRTSWTGPTKAFVRTGLFEAVERASATVHKGAFKAIKAPKGLASLKSEYISKLDDETFCLQFLDEAPVEISDQGPSIQKLIYPADHGCDSDVAFHGDVRALIAAGVVNEHQVPEPRGKRPRYRKSSAWNSAAGSTYWESQLQVDGSLFVRLRRRAAELKNSGASPMTVEEWLETKEDAICKIAEHFCRQTSITFSDGTKLQADAKQLDEIQQQIEAAAQLLRNVTVRSLSPTSKASRDRASAATSDADFQRFMSKLAPR